VGVEKQRPRNAFVVRCRERQCLSQAFSPLDCCTTSFHNRRSRRRRRSRTTSGKTPRASSAARRRSVPPLGAAGSAALLKLRQALLPKSTPCGWRAARHAARTPCAAARRMAFQGTRPRPHAAGKRRVVQLTADSSRGERAGGKG
jgi:hypothetical protein